MNEVSIRIASDTATPELQRWIGELGVARFHGRVNDDLVQVTMVHLKQLGGNVRGYPSTGFYEKFARGVLCIPTENGVAVVIPPQIIQGRVVGLGMRVFGGTITPQTVKMLAIPISPVSYGHVPGEFPNLFLLKTVKGDYLCQRGEEVSDKTGRIRQVGKSGLKGNVGRRINSNLVFLFKLVSSVTQDGNRDVLPSDEKLLQTAIDAVGRGLN